MECECGCGNNSNRCKEPLPVKSGPKTDIKPWRHYADGCPWRRIEDGYPPLITCSGNIDDFNVYAPCCEEECAIYHFVKNS